MSGVGQGQGQWRSMRHVRMAESLSRSFDGQSAGSQQTRGSTTMHESEDTGRPRLRLGFDAGIALLAMFVLFTGYMLAKL